MTTFADIFLGFGGVTAGAMAAGLTPIWAIEKRPDVAAVASANLGEHVIVTDILDVDPGALVRPDVLHASPPCPSFSTANPKRGETRADIALGETVARFIRILQPKCFTLENVYLYRKSESFAAIRQALNECGYWFDLAHVDAADFGVPQNRKRMWVRALRGRMVPRLPAPEPWRNWYQAIEDLIPSLPDSQFAKWQLERGVEAIVGKERALVSQGSFDHANAENERESQSLGIRRENQPAFTVTSNSSMLGMRAFIVGGQYARPTNDSGLPRPAQMRGQDEPVFTVTASNKGDWRAGLPGGRVVQMISRCGARWQTFPDEFELSGSSTLDWYGIGNAVPPLQYRKLIAPLVAML